jgi:hypothetical protein
MNYMASLITSMAETAQIRHCKAQDKHAKEVVFPHLHPGHPAMLFLSSGKGFL